MLFLNGLTLSNKALYLRALDVYETYTNLDFEDAVAVAMVEHMSPTELYSYDKDFDAVRTVTRLEPS